MFTHPDLYNHRFVKDPKKIIQAYHMANSDDAKSRDTRYLMSLLQRMPSVHGPLQRHIERLKSLVVSAPWSITPHDEGDEELAINAKRRVERVMSKMFDLFISGKLYGVSLGELDYKPSELGFIPIFNKQYDPTEIEYNPDYFYNVAILQPTDMGFMRNEIQESNFANFISYHDTSKSIRGGLLYAVIYQVMMLVLNEQEWIQYTQKLKGIIQGAYQPGSTTEEKKAAEEAIKQAANSNAFFGSKSIEFMFHQLTSNNASDNFKDFLEYLKNDVEITITGESQLASDKERNAWTVQERNAQDVAFWHRQQFVEWINNTLLKYDYYLNVRRDLDVELPYTFIWDIKEEQDREANVRIIEAVMAMGGEITVKEVQDKSGIELAQDGDVILKQGGFVAPVIEGGEKETSPQPSPEGEGE